YPSLAGSSHLRALLSFLVEQTLDGKTAELKEYTIAVEVFGRPASFDPRLNPIVRVQASNLRAKLKQYYADTGSGDPLGIDWPRGTYIPQFISRPEKQTAAARHDGAPLFTSLAVLPCADFSPTQNQEYFCDGITEEIISALASLGGVRVVGRTSVIGFKAK